ncbi:MAG TPA: hypothetical protein VGI10_19340 [Polyangiaceae bacterium]|jgi:hypothetical protein
MAAGISDEHPNFRTHVLQTVRTLNADPIALDEGCIYRGIVLPSILGDGFLPYDNDGGTTQRLAVLEQQMMRLAGLEQEVKHLKEQLLQRAPTASALSMLDALIGDFKPEGVRDEDDEFLAMAFAPTEAE